MRSITRRILFSAYSGRMTEERYDFLWLLAPCSSEGEPLDHDVLSSWSSSIEGYQSLVEHQQSGPNHISDCGLIWKQGDMRKYMLDISSTADSSLSIVSDNPCVLVTRLPKRRDFLHRVLGVSGGNGAHTKVEPLMVAECMSDNLPVRYSLFALMFPSILHRIEVALIAEVLRTTLLHPVSFEPTQLPVVIKALTSSSTDEEDTYQRLEFLGDCILKFIASVHLMAAHPAWPESYLTGKKGRIVSNGFLARATLATGLDRFIFTKRFTGTKWKPRYVEEVLANSKPEEKVERSSKLIADVIESLIGASFAVGGFVKAFACVRTLLTQEPWTPLDSANGKLYDAAPGADMANMVTGLGVVEMLVGYSFSKKMLLLEALTHPSFNGPNVHCSYERLEFLGDAVLDYVVSKRLYEHRPELSHQTMHAMRTAMVNASFLTFRMFETTVEEEMIEKSTMHTRMHKRALWQFLRSGNHQVVASRALALEQHSQAQQQIDLALQREARFPWHLLALTDAPKFLSDIVESVIGAVYVDSHGDFAACEVFIRRLGILDCLERVLRDQVDCLHPKERLGHLAVEKDVRYVRIEGEGEDGEDGKRSYRCQVKVGGESVGGVVKGLKRLNAETIAAWKAVSILENSSGVFMDDTDEEDVFVDAEEGR